jgi:hypothetical protein
MAQTSAPLSLAVRTQATPTLYNLLVTDITDLYGRATGWIEVADDAWAYTDVSTITAQNVRTYTTGTKFRYKQGGAYKYGVITTGGATTLRIGLSDDYILANAAITDIAISHSLSPLDWPGSFTWTVSGTITGWSTDPTITVIYSIEGNVAFVRASSTSQTSNSALIRFPRPFTATVSGSLNGTCTVRDNGTTATTPGYMTTIAPNLFGVLRDFADTNFTNSGAKFFEDASIILFLT